ncbi:hypothetical protein GHK33_20425 [Sinorhizobium meliloti]|uniref:Uncharacterized protein n=1 Tax=Rhizobium meliloti TaxID=382 RepID=A0A6A7ZV00_RHIML|nr:hypothetical protein [Sinorhizobium meliloti]MDW9376791.1 hypothetical protein [Sinorhizobium meliloti]MDW9495397.1 hypothetical protein [Sinorhizobium meliloti]MDW9563752.1 hypothetical protein [Sinorhizobium meliloti]MDW9651114.1 hypothetical protein [Sinorhizobium meliloti]MDW9861636.1 hypothetical protein [Sinorhizobium meliloti]
MRRQGQGRLSIEIADQTAPRDPKYQGRHYRACLVDAHTVIEAFRQRITDIEAELEKVRRDCEYKLSLCVTRTAAEEARLSAFRLAQEKAALLMESPGGILNEASEAIRAIPDPKPKFTR